MQHKRARMTEPQAAHKQRKNIMNSAFKSAEPLRMKFLTFHFGKNTVGYGMVYQLTNDFDAVTYTCDPAPMITPCKVKTAHCAYNINMSSHHPFCYVIATFYLKAIFENGN